MDAKQFAARLSGREYGSEITKEEEKIAKEYGLVVAFGYSDDCAEFRGAITEEASAYGGAKIYISTSGEVLSGDHECDCDHCGYKAKKSKASLVEFRTDHMEFAWWIETDIPHERFTIYEDGSHFCSGIVFALAGVKK